MEWNPIWSQVRVSAPILQMISKKKKTIVFSIIALTDGEKIRIRFSGSLSKKAVVIGSLRIWVGGQSKPITVNGETTFSIPAGQELLSDEINLVVNRGDNIEVRIYYKSKTAESNAIEEEAISFAGDKTRIENLPYYQAPAYKDKYGVYEFIGGISKIELYSKQPAYRIIAFGDSITSMSRWTKPLQKRLQDQYSGKYILLNAGISGNCLLYEKKGITGSLFGHKGIDRFSKDVLSEENLHAVILALGVNDITYFNSKTKNIINLENYRSSVTHLVKQLRSKGVRVIGQTLSPRKGYSFGKYTDEMETLRQDINNWIRSCNLFDWLIDTDVLLRDPQNPTVVKDGLHQGDFLHPNQKGGQVIADAYDLQKLVGE